ncbi:hypothetical protein [Natrarchaeobius chitinivorans]|nr:hypothetical protein [Natrarchaeobius chitinivorans]
MQIDIDSRWTLLAVGFVFALFWTGYFRISIFPKLVEDDEEDE